MNVHMTMRIDAMVIRSCSAATRQCKGDGCQTYNSNCAGDGEQVVAILHDAL